LPSLNDLTTENPIGATKLAELESIRAMHVFIAGIANAMCERFLAALGVSLIVSSVA